MNSRKAKALRKIAAREATAQKSYLVKKETKVFTDFNGNHMPYVTEQVRLHPNCAEAIIKTFKSLKKRPEAWSLEEMLKMGYVEVAV